MQVKKFEPIDIEFNFLILKVVPKLSEIWVGGPRSDFRKNYTGPGSRGQKATDPGSGSATLRVCGSEKTNLICLLLLKVGSKYYHLSLLNVFAFFLSCSYRGIPFRSLSEPFTCLN